MAEFILPNLGDGVAQGDVLKVLVKAGDAVAVDQPVLELETDKATIEVPSNVAGKVTEVRVKAGDKVKPGQAVLVLDNGSPARPEAAAAESRRGSPETERAKADAGGAAVEAPKQDDRQDGGKTDAAKPAESAKPGDAAAEPAEAA